VIADDTLQGLHRLLPISNVDCHRTRQRGRFKPEQLLTLPEVKSSELQEGTLRVGVRDLPAGANSILQWLAKKDTPTIMCSERRIWNCFSHPHRKEPSDSR